jgi:hypothetical protein
MFALLFGLFKLPGGMKRAAGGGATVRPQKP